MIDQERSLAMYILLSIITCGIYSYYWIYKVAEDTNTMCEGDGNETKGLLIFILLSLVTLGIYAWFWYYQLGNRLAANAPRYGLSFQEDGTTILLWMLFGALLCGIGPFVAWYYLINNMNAMAAVYNRMHSGGYGPGSYGGYGAGARYQQPYPGAQPNPEIGRASCRERV